MRASHLLVSKLVVSGVVAAIEMVSFRSEDYKTKPSVVVWLLGSAAS